MDLAAIIALATSANADPTTQSEHEEVSTVETVIGRNISPKELRAVRTAPIRKALTANIVQPTFVPSLDARSFIIAMRKASTRDEQIKCIAAYVGYDPTGNFGPQEVAARAKAQRELSGRPIQGATMAEVKAASRSMTGFVAGMPQPSQKLLANLRAREQATTASMIAATTDAERTAYRQALDTIQAAIDELVG